MIRPALGRTINPDANEILRVYLGSDGHGGYQPLGCEDRFKKAFPADSKEKLREIQKYLDFDCPLDPLERHLLRIVQVAEEALRRKFPELRDTIAKALANRFTYNNK